MRITKRDGRTVAYDGAKIIAAILKSGARDESAESIETVITADLASIAASGDETVATVEQIQDAVETELMKLEPDAAKRYILYREERSRARAHRARPDTSAIADYTHLSKYSRFDPALGRRETWDESVTRRMGMDLRRFPMLETEIRSVYDDFVRPKRVLPSMRSMQFGGVALEANHARMFNCAFTLMDRPRAFAEIFFLLLSGCGVGYSVQRRHVEKLPPVMEPTRRVIKHHRVGDTIEGWAHALEMLTQSFLGADLRWVEFIYEDIRVQGSPLKTSGGLAPGHVPLRTMLEKVRLIFERAMGRHLKPIEVHDICCLVAEAVLAGGIRRSSLISLFSPTDFEMMDCKTGDWFTSAPWRAMANNSAVFLRQNENRAQFDSIFERNRQYGEPGFCFVDDKDYGMNPCGEIGLDPRDEITGETGFGFCNLTEINATLVQGEDDFIAACEAASFLGTLQASYVDFPFLTSASRNIARNDALLGVSITGMMDNPIVRDPRLLTRGAERVKFINDHFAPLVGVLPAMRLTTVKPSGTASLLLGCVGSGIHPHHARRYIRRVTANPIEPVFQFFRDTNPHMVVKKPNGDYVIEFPIQVPDDAMTLSSISAVDFMEEVFAVYDAWIKPGTARTARSPGLTHNVSCTVVVQDADWHRVAEIAWENRHRISAMSFLPATADKAYSFAPREAIETAADEARWNELIEKYRPVDWTKMHEEEDTTAPGDVSACEGPSCEIPRKDPSLAMTEALRDSLERGTS